MIITKNNVIADADSTANNRINDAIGNKTDSPVDTASTASLIALTRHIAEAVNNGTGTAIGTNLSLVDLLDYVQAEVQAVKGDYEKFNVADADGTNFKWTAAYVNGTEGGSADIDTTTANKATIIVDPDGTPTAAAYTMAHNIPIRGKKWRVICDVNTTFGAQDASWAAVGLRISKTTYDNDNIVYIERQESSAGVNERITSGSNFGGAGATENYTTDANDDYSFMIERDGNVWNCYYSLTQSPDYEWVLNGSYTDTTNIPDDVTVHLLAYSPGSADAQSAQGDFGEFIIDMNPESSEYEGSFSYLDAGGEQTIVEITPTTRKAVKGIWLELDNMINDGTVKFYYKIDGTNYRELTQYEYAFVVLDTDDFLFLPCDCYINHDFKVTYTEGADEGAARAVRYQLIVEDMEN